MREMTAADLYWETRKGEETRRLARLIGDVMALCFVNSIEGDYPNDKLILVIICAIQYVTHNYDRRKEIRCKELIDAVCRSGGQNESVSDVSK